MIGISTCWWNNKDPRAKDIVAQALELGFGGLELEYRLSNTIYQEIRQELKGKLKVLSLHNYFPKPDDPRIETGSGDLFLLSSEDRDERAKAVDYSIRTIEHANDLECGAVILHLGRVEMDNPFEHFKELYNNGKIENSEGLHFLEEQHHIRRLIHRRYLDNVLFGLEKLNRAAEKNSVLLGIENRYHFHEIPNFEEIGYILKEFKGSNLRYWHDVGHADVQEKLGSCKQQALLKAYSGQMIGIHLHDIKALEDHLAPGQGEMDYNEIKPFLNQNMIKIMEIHSKVKREALMEGRKVMGDFFLLEEK